MRAVVAAEWLKLRTLRGAALGAGVVALAVIGAAALTVYTTRLYDGLEPGRRSHLEVSPLEPLVTQVAEIALGVVAVLVMSTEHREGTLRLTLTTVPRRGRLAAAKALVVGAAATVIALAAVFGTLGIGSLLIGDRRIELLTDPEFHTPALLTARALTVPMIALIGLGLAMCLRSTAASVTTLVTVLLVVPLLAQAVPGVAGRWLRAVEPEALAGQAAGAGNPYSVYGSGLPTWVAALLMIAYPALSLASGTYVLRRRDA
jgi:ABC-2 type transport system permease protein